MSASQRLLVVMHPVGRGGALRSTSLLLEGALEAGAIATMAVLDGRSIPRIRAHVPDAVAMMELGWRSRLHLPLVAWRLGRLLRKTRPDVVIAVNTYSAIVLLLAERLGGHRPPTIVRELMDPRQLAATAPTRVKLALARRLYRDATVVVTSSDGVSATVERLYRLPPAKVRRIYNGYDRRLDQPLDIAEPPHRWLDGSLPALLYVGRLVPLKGVDVLIDALADLRDGGRRARLLVIGEGPERARLERLVDQRALDDAVAFLGYVDRPYAHMALADAVVVPSRSEAFGNVIVETMRAGGLVIASDCDYGPREIIIGRSGLLVPPAEPPALAAAIERVLADRSLSDALRAGGRRRAADFSPARMASEWAALLDELARPRSPASALGKAGEGLPVDLA